MVSIQINGGELDVYSEQDICFDWTAYRFAGGLAAPFSTDMDIPKTANNLHLIGYDSLLDSPNQQFGNELKPAVMCLNGRMVGCYLQLVSVRDKDLTICIYENVFPLDRDVALNRAVEDDENSIFVWSLNSKTAYPQWFQNYLYGSRWDFNAAQLHPSKSMNGVFQRIGGLPQIDDDLMLLAQNKYVCPSNRKQVVATHLGETTACVLVGGQHIVNDIEGYDGRMKVGDSDVTEITYNRQCRAEANVWLSWGKKRGVSGNFYYRIYKNGSIVTEIPIVATDRSGLYIRSGIAFDIEEGDVVTFKMWRNNDGRPQDSFELVSAVIEFTYSDYDITEDDYGNELVYCAKHPALVRWDPPNVNTTDHYFDGSTAVWYTYKNNGGVSTTRRLNLPFLGYSYFGYYCNLSDEKIGDLLYSLGWLKGMKMKYIDGVPVFVNPNNIRETDGYITETRPASDRIGRRNLIRFEGQDEGGEVSAVDNRWLADEQTVHQSVLAYVRETLSYGKIDQYEITYGGDGVGDAKYNEIKGVVVMRFYDRIGRYPYSVGLIPPGSIGTLGFERITATVEADIETYGDLMEEADYLIIDGRKFMVIEGTNDLKTGKCQITALLVPTQ